MLKFIEITNITDVVALLFKKYNGNAVEVEGEEDTKKVLNAMLLFDDIKADNLDTSEKARKYAINNNIAKRWCPVNGISASNDELPARYSSVLHKRVLRHSCQTFFRKRVKIKTSLSIISIKIKKIILGNHNN